MLAQQVNGQPSGYNDTGGLPGVDVDYQETLVCFQGEDKWTKKVPKGKKSKTRKKGKKSCMQKQFLA